MKAFCILKRSFLNIIYKYLYYGDKSKTDTKFKCWHNPQNLESITSIHSRIQYIKAYVYFIFKTQR